MIERPLLSISARRPCRFIDGERGEPYLERHYLFGAFGWHAYLHRFVDSDPDRGLHDHPWGRAVSLVLSGGYDEIRPLSVDPARTHVRFLRPWRFNLLRCADFQWRSASSPVGQSAGLRATACRAWMAATS